MDNVLQPALDSSQLALLEFDDIIVSFPQTQVLTIENLSQINTPQSTGKSYGTLSYNLSELPVYTFNHDLALMDQPAINNRFCIAIKHPDENEFFAITCDTVNQYNIKDRATITAIPSLMHNPDSPVIKLVKKDNRLILMSNAESMRTYINSQEEVEYV